MLPSFSVVQSARALGERLVLASHNPGKLVELRTLLRAWGLELASAGGLGLPEPAETGESFEANARIKALSAAAASDLPALADDTGLVVPVLAGAPGVHTARWADEHGGWRKARRTLAEQTGLLESEGPVQAELHCALCLAWPDGEAVVASAVVSGTLHWPPEPALPGFAAMFEPHVGLVSHRGILIHRQLAFTRLEAMLREREGVISPSGR